MSIAPLVLLEKGGGKDGFIKPVDGLGYMWDFLPSNPGIRRQYQRLICNIFRAKAFPPHHTIKAPTSQEKWIVLFLYVPTGALDQSQSFTLHRLRDIGIPLMVVLASPHSNMVPEDVLANTEALIWKSMDGYDFSAYTLALDSISKYSAGAQVLIMNDSMYGPFSDLRKFMNIQTWDLMGFTSSALGQNHIQSYSFCFQAVDFSTLTTLSDIFRTQSCFSRAGDVILCQEIRLAQVASRHMSVGSIWHADGVQYEDACLNKPIQLLDAGFPFMKKSLLNKRADFQKAEEMIMQLVSLGHPAPALKNH